MRGGHEVEPKWLEWAKQLQAIAQTGLAYSKDIYDIERFEMIRQLSVEIMAEYTTVDNEKIKELFASEIGYATPKVDIRAAVFKENKILMVKENSDGYWSLPGGWADIGLSPSEVAVKEVKEETGLDVKAIKLLGVLDKKFYPHLPAYYHLYKIFIQCELIGGDMKTSIETSDVGFFGEDELPPLSMSRVTEPQIKWAFKHLYFPHTSAYVD